MSSLPESLCDVLIIGGGPAGGQCARELASMGRKVILAEKHPDLRCNNFSSGGVPMDFVREFGIPEELIGAKWKRIRISSSRETFDWESANELGAVIDFAGLREYLAAEARSFGCEVRLGTRFAGMDIDRAGVRARMTTGGESREVLARVLVDATGPQREVMRLVDPAPKPGMIAAGFEKILKVRPGALPENELAFFLGMRWVPQGYGWIFPMGKGVYKIGAAAFHAPGRRYPVLSECVGRIVDACAFESVPCALDVHAGCMKYTDGLADRYWHRHVIGVGDAVSCINPLGCEGIRHGMYSSRVAARHIDRYLKGRTGDFRDYRRELRRHFGLKWRLSERISRRVYMRLNDDEMTRGLRGVAKLSVDDLMGVLFRYDFGKVFCPGLWIRLVISCLKAVCLRKIPSPDSRSR